MGRILIDVRVSSFADILTNQEKVRTIEIKNAIVDTGAAMLNLHRDQIEALGLKFLRKVKVRTANGSPERNVYGVARVEIQGREGEFDVLEAPDDVPVLVGYIVLEQLDLVADTSNHRLLSNPAHGGEYALDLY
ncbi:MAG: aspartyl protease [Planctomycetes bacterium]|nr:aspartyl protease [Planctomycetota bacterium]MBM4083321.1 aspartyl protease [Planctomycetota bacterium]